MFCDAYCLTEVSLSINLNKKSTLIFIEVVRCTYNSERGGDRGSEATTPLTLLKLMLKINIFAYFYALEI